MEQRGHVQQPGLVPLAGQLAAERVLVRMLGDEEAAHVAHHHQDVLVDRVHMEQVVLHAPDDAAEHPQVAPQHRGLVEQPQRMRDALRLAQDLHEHGAVGRVAAEARVHQVARVVQRAQRARRQPLDARRALVHQEGAHQRVRVFAVEPVVRHLEHAATVEELRVDRPHRRFLGAVDALLDVQHQDLVQLRHRLGRPVVAVHQHLGRALALGGLVAEALGHGGLQVEHQPVLAPPGNQVQPRADQLQRTFVLEQLADLEGRDQALGRQLRPVAAQAGGPRHPDHELQVAQAARAFLAVGLEGIGRVLVLDMALAHLQHLGAQKGLGVHHRVGGLAEGGVHAARSAQETRLEHRGLHRHVAPCLLDAFVDGAHRRADLQPDVPAGVHEALDRGAQGVGGIAVLAFGACGVEPGAGRQQHQHIDVRVREQLAAPEPAHRHQRGARGQRRMLPELEQMGIDMAGQRLGQTRRRQRGGARFAKVLQQRGLAVAKARAHRGHAVRRVRLARQRAFGHGRHLQPPTKAGGAGLAADSVSTS
jgi:hypothetical protein